MKHAITLTAAAVLLCASADWQPAQAYPPAPHHLIYGCVRDQYGTPLWVPNARVILITSSGVAVPAAITPGVGPGINYELQVPMDAGISPDLYQASALRPATAFKVFVVTGSVTNVPIQMTADFSHLGQPGGQSRVDLTLGMDANGDGIPDAWEYAFLAALGLDLSLNDLNMGMDLAQDGRTLMQEYLLGNYPFDPEEPLVVRMVAHNGGSPILEFTGMVGHSYTIVGSADLKQWTQLSFRIPAEGAAGGVYSYYYASAINTVQVQVTQPASGAPITFFRIQVQ